MIVLDTSFVAKLLMREVSIDIFNTTEYFITSDLFDYEIANVLWKIARYQSLSKTEIMPLFQAIDILSMCREKTEPHKLFLCALETELSAYDSAYFLLAQKYKCPLATFDKKLAEIAQNAGIKVFN